MSAFQHTSELGPIIKKARIANIARINRLDDYEALEQVAERLEAINGRYDAEFAQRLRVIAKRLEQEA